ncbi:DUF4347 domain-containing protein, partial [Vibrio thalassae]
MNATFTILVKYLIKLVLPIVFLTCTSLIYLHYESKKTYEVVIIDSGVKNSELLLRGLKREADIFYLMKEEDGIDNIYKIIKEKENISTLHIVSHGENGTVHLGNARLNIKNINFYKDTLSKWNGSFEKDGRIILYGCNIAYDVHGKSFINTLKEIINLDIYASDNLTGSNKLDGDDVFEFQA